jgi:hypothetical protein
MKNTINAIKLDYENHYDLSLKIYEFLKNIVENKKDCERNTFVAIPKIRKPYFWQFNKKKKYKQECDSIFEDFKKWNEESENLIKKKEI